MIRLIAQITLKFAGKEDQKVYKNVVLFVYYKIQILPINPAVNPRYKNNKKFIQRPEMV